MASKETNYILSNCGLVTWHIVNWTNAWIGTIPEPWWRHQHFSRYWPFVRGIHRSTVNPPHKGQWRGALMFSLICVRINDWVNNREAGDLRCHCTHYDVIVMPTKTLMHMLPGLNHSMPSIKQHSVKYRNLWCSRTWPKNVLFSNMNAKH